MTDRVVVIEAPTPLRTVTVVDPDGELAIAVQVGDRTVSIRSDAGVPAVDLIALGDERWLSNSYEPPAADWDSIDNKPTDLATTGQISSAIAAVIASSPASLDTLNELANALGDDANFAATVNTALGLRATTAALTTETSARTAADTALQSNITSEASTRSAADTALQSNIDAEAAARASAITAEATARNAAIAAAVASLVNSAPGALDTLKELADAMGDDANFATTVSNALALKAPIASPGLTGTPTATTATTGDSSTRIATTAFVGTAVFAEATARSTVDALKANIASPSFTGTLTTTKATGFNNPAIVMQENGVTSSSGGGLARFNLFSNLPGAIANVSLNFPITSGGVSSRDDTSKSAWGFTLDNRTGIDQFRINYFAGTDYFPLQIAADSTVKIAKAATTGTNGTSQLQIIPNAVGIVGLALTAIAAQTANALEVQNSSNVAVASISAAGNLTVAKSVNLKTATTPTGTADSQGTTRDVMADDSYIYVKTSAGWKRATLATF